MADEEKFIDVVYGPDRGARLKVATAFANAAIKAGWARDANEPFDPEKVEEPKPGALAAAVAAAIKGMRKLRGEPDEDGKVEAEAEEPEEDEDDGDYSDDVYQTTDMKPAPKRGPGRPRTR